jgi:dihydrodipicolinate synthase/N-acetylneuraminate lyase
MSTAGTSQFNLMDQKEIHNFNSCLAESFEGSKILGIPPVNTAIACNFVKDAKQYVGKNVKLMALYPDRFYGEEAVIKYIESICNSLGDSVYLHANKMRSGTSGDWNYHSETINKLHELGLIVGIKEEHSDLQASYNFVRGLNTELDIIVAGGSMRRFSFLESAGANSFLSGIGNIFPEVEHKFLDNEDRIKRSIKNNGFNLLK